MEQKDFKDLEDVVALGLGMAQAGIAMAEDGRLGLDDLPKVMAVLPLVPAALEGITRVPAQALALDGPEMDKIASDLEARMPQLQGKARKIVVASLKLALALKDLTVAIVEPEAAPAPAVAAEAPAAPAAQA